MLQITKLEIYGHTEIWINLFLICVVLQKGKQFAICILFHFIFACFFYKELILQF